ncbi:MAG TPA: amidase [Thermoanaerobaculia bacterium]|nr:amidase [Thermoanaerobaculia bacterium]
MREIWTSSLVDLGHLLQRRELSPVELMTSVLDRVDRTHEALNAVVALRDRETLLAEARASETRLARGDGRPLEGIPLGVKDLEDVAGMKTTFGSIPFRDNFATTDSTQVARLRAAGAIVVAKTNTPEFGFTAITKNLLFRDTRSPWDLARTPGGSSGGSAAVLAGGVLPLVTASDGGGSIRIPASFVGAFGLKPSAGRVPRGPFSRWDWSNTSVYGPLTKTVEDGALFLDLVAGPSDDDPTSLPSAGVRYADEVNRPLDAPLRIALSLDLGYAAVQSDIAASIEEAAQVFTRLGHRVLGLAGGPPQLGAEWSALMYLDLAGIHSPWFATRESEITRALAQGIREASRIDPVSWDAMRRRRAELNRWCSELFRDHDLLLLPTVSFDPPPSRGPFPTETEGRPQPPAAAGALTIPFNMSGHPAATVRAGLSRAGFPVGLQIVGPRHRDDLVLRAARTFERERPWHPEWPVDFTDG